MFTWFGPVAYRRKLTVDGRGIKAQATVRLRDRAPVILSQQLPGPYRGRVAGIATRLVEHPAGEIWADLVLEDAVQDVTRSFTYPEIDLTREFAVDNTFTGQHWFDELEIMAITLGSRPAWKRLRPINQGA